MSPAPFTLQRLIALLAPHVTYTLECEPEHTDPSEGFDDSEDSRDTVAYVHSEIASGNPWAWFVAHVTATCTISTLKGDDYLGCCSYSSEEDFKQPGGYYEDMRDEALRDLARQIWNRIEEADALITNLRALEVAP